MLSRKLMTSIVVGIAMVAIGGSTYGIVEATSGRGPAGVSSGPSGGHGSGGDSNARSEPAAGGTSGTVGSVSGSGFTISTSAGQQVTVKETSTTRYQKGTTGASASAVTKGEPVLALGKTSGTTITATQVIVQPADGGSATSSAKVVPFKRGAPNTSKQVGRTPANWSEGSGTIVSGTAANKATEAALAAYPGGVVDRVVRLSDGEYNVHYIGVSWPHHVFVDQDFKVVGAE